MSWQLFPLPTQVLQPLPSQAALSTLLTTADANATLPPLHDWINEEGCVFLSNPLLHHNLCPQSPSMPPFPLWQLDRFVSPILNPYAYPTPPAAFPTSTPLATASSSTKNSYIITYSHSSFHQFIYSNSRITTYYHSPYHHQLIYSNPRKFAFKSQGPSTDDTTTPIKMIASCVFTCYLNKYCKWDNTPPIDKKIH